jgi:hypothetical protein
MKCAPRFFDTVSTWSCDRYETAYRDTLSYLGVSFAWETWTVRVRQSSTIFMSNRYKRGWVCNNKKKGYYNLTNYVCSGRTLNTERKKKIVINNNNNSKPIRYCLWLCGCTTRPYHKHWPLVARARRPEAVRASTRKLGNSTRPHRRITKIKSMRAMYLYVSILLPDKTVRTSTCCERFTGNRECAL